MLVLLAVLFFLVHGTEKLSKHIIFSVRMANIVGSKSDTHAIWTSFHGDA